MGRPSTAKAPMATSDPKFVRSEPNQPFPQEFIDILAAFPVENGGSSASDGDEPPQKRARVVEPQEAITIARDTLTLKRRKPSGTREAILQSFRRPCIEHSTRFRVDMLEERSRHMAKTLAFSTLPGSGFGKYKFEIGLGNAFPLSSSLATIFEVINSSKDTPNNDGAVWVSIDVSFDVIAGEHHLCFDFSLRWAQSNNIYQGLRNLQQRKITDQIRKEFLNSQAGPVIRNSGVLSPQTFYDAAFQSEEDSSHLNTATIPGLASDLYPFQRRALQWLLARERVQWTSGNHGRSFELQELPVSSNGSLPMSFDERQDANGDKFYHSGLYHVATKDVGPWHELEFLLRGGILAEEMGLGKTVEMISLILLHRRPSGPSHLFDTYTGKQVRATSATLIVTPETLRQQWISEIARHAPNLNIMTYEGRSKHREDEEGLIQQMLENDIVVTTYNVLRTEVHFARPEPDRSRRHERSHSRATSPLTKLSWWRVCLDEAQQIESGVSAAAEVARLVPRVNAWGVTGTPVKERIKDLWGLLLFLRYDPFATYPVIWDALVSNHHDDFRNLFNRLALRHTKHAVRHELFLPPQHRYVITVPFSAVEEQNYRSRFKQEVEALGLDTSGTPLIPAAWDPNKPATIESMRRILASLRQIVLHPQLGPERVRLLGNVSKAIKTIDEVLDAMIDQIDTVIKTHQRAYLVAKLRRGQLLENSPRVREALVIWQDALQEIEVLEAECREQLRIEMENATNADDKDREAANDEFELDDDSDDEQNVPPRLGEARRRLRSALDLKHRAVFFIASAYFQIKSNEDMTQPESEEFKRLEKLEVDGYEKANQIRQEILEEVHEKASSYLVELARKASTQSFVDIPELQCQLKAGLETGRHLDEYLQVTESLNDQADMVDEWREQVIGLLLKPLVDQEEGEITGEEYENSTKIQDDLMVYTTILRAVISDRQDALSGLINERTRHELKIFAQQAKQGEGPSPETFLELLKQREAVKANKVHGSLRAVVSNLRELATKLQSDNTTRSSAELRIVRDLQKHIHEATVEQTKTNADLEKELAFFTSAMNARVEYYRQLQAVSDTVAAWEREDDEDDAVLMDGLFNEEAKCAQKMNAAIATQRYQIHLKAQGQGTTKKTCPICTDVYTVGILTPCTHEFCQDCIKQWVAAHHRCPLCKKPVSMANCHVITTKEPTLKLLKDQQTAASTGADVPESPHKSRTRGIYNEFGEDKLKEINAAALDGPALPTKVNALIRHLLWLRSTDAGAKSVIFSQFGAFLDILKQALEHYNIGFSSFATKNGITRFKEDPAIECFLMDARAHASGLNLVNANHVFLCEPLLNTALELQAIARVDRIGQKHETNVWLYLVEGTVEESIHQISTKRRMEHMATTSKGKGKGSSTPELSEDNLEVANSMELQQANLVKLMDKDARLGEKVDQSDLWDCLFGHVARENDVQAAVVSLDPRFEDRAVRGFLAGQAAEERRGAEERYHQAEQQQDALAETTRYHESDDSATDDSELD